MMNRRKFLTASAVAFAAPYVVPRHILGGNGFVAANDRIQIGLIGCGVRGKYLTANLPADGRVIALCDFDVAAFDTLLHPQKEFEQPLAGFAQTDARSCARYVDYRSMFDLSGLDAVMIATPDHHHILAAVLACQAGKDVYCEKPLSLTIAEGRVLVDAAEKYQRIVQVGSQQRTMAVNRQGCEFIHNGGLGRISLVEMRNLPGPMPVESLAEEPPQSGSHWNLFLGPAAERPESKYLWVKDQFKVGYLLWRGWDLYRDYSGHLMTNWGGHSVDMIQLALGMDHTGPVEVTPLIPGSDDADEVSRHWSTLDDQWHDKTPPLGAVKDRNKDRMRFCPVSWRYASGVEVRLSPEVKAEVFHGEKGTLTMSRNKFVTDPIELMPPPLPEDEVHKWDGSGHVARPHLANWLECIRQRTTPNAPVEAGQRTASICHLVNMARELGRPLRWNPDQEQFVDDVEANRLLDRPRRKGWELPRI